MCVWRYLNRKQENKWVVVGAVDPWVRGNTFPFPSFRFHFISQNIPPLSPKIISLRNFRMVGTTGGWASRPQPGWKLQTGKKSAEKFPSQILGGLLKVFRHFAPAPEIDGNPPPGSPPIATATFPLGGQANLGSQTIFLKKHWRGLSQPPNFRGGLGLPFQTVCVTVI